MKKITHAVIPVAGFGTRMLPLSKSVPKELLPLGNRPAIHYVVEEAIAAGIKHIVLVGHAQKSAIENYFDINAELDNQLRHKGKDELADSLNWLPDDVTVSMIRQGKALGLGHAVLAARPIIGEHDFAVLLPDVVLDPFTGDMATENLAFMIDAFAEDNHSQILVDKVADEDVHKYGIAKLNEAFSEDDKANINASFKVAGFVEKPNLADAPSKLAVVGRYVFSNHIFDYLANTKASVGGEIQLTDAIDALISEYGVNVTTMRGDSYDAGDMRSYMQSFIYFAQQQLAEDE
ncbi:UTP--glucose-1-phosphate uridylyltransferase [Psychrobacter glacincola]|uniref:UTP--glucose-1-phosphate uridylyltransferase n=1 Tax=Psychrobacter glacincola TaxID=56810 RepID=UPI003FD56B2C